MPESTILMPDFRGYHNINPDTNNRLDRSKSYQDLSTIIIAPITGDLSPIVVQSWMGLMKPMNQKVIGPIFAQGYEVGHAYNETIKSILANPELSKWKYIMTLEHDNLPPADGLLKLYENMDQYDVIGGLYWTKGEGGQPMIYGNPQVLPMNFIPQRPIVDGIQPANGLGMGFNLFKMDIFKKMPYPWFRTIQEFAPGEGAKMYTQDLYFYEKAAKEGYKFACDTRVKVGHYDKSTNIIW